MKILGAQHETRNPRFLQGLNAKGPRQCAKERAKEEKLTGTRGQFKVRQLSMRLGIHVMDTGVTDDALGHPPTTLTEIRSFGLLSSHRVHCVMSASWPPHWKPWLQEAPSVHVRFLPMSTVTGVQPSDAGQNRLYMLQKLVEKSHLDDTWLSLHATTRHICVGWPETSA